ncbi:MAG: hypothetical protein P4M13_08995 [Alphaproteobacteria bacterium]|nr:hypothetical protein [Alphaproteobacteria bacterium]
MFGFGAINKNGKKVKQPTVSLTYDEAARLDNRSITAVKALFWGASLATAADSIALGMGFAIFHHIPSRSGIYFVAFSTLLYGSFSVYSKMRKHAKRMLEDGRSAGRVLGFFPAIPENRLKGRMKKDPHP